MPSVNIYDQRYLGNYREHLSGYEIARWNALDHFISKIMKLDSGIDILDYGAGSGLHFELWEKKFPKSKLYFCDISKVAMKKFKAKYPDYSDHYYLVNEDRPNNIEKKFDLIISVEVMEHVSDLDFYLDQINSLLKKGGYFIWTTPCANWFSIEHIYSLITGKIEKTKEGYRKWTWEDPTHLRRLKSSEIKSLLQLRGFSNIKFRFRAHLFSYLCTNWPILRKKIISNRLFNLDYYLFRYLPNGASMIGSAKKV